MRAIEILEKIFGRGMVQGEETLFFCPLCKDVQHKGNPRKLSVNISKNKFKCWHCDTLSGSLERLVRRFGSDEDVAMWRGVTGRLDFSLSNLSILGEKEKPGVDPQLPPEFISFWENGSLLASRPRNYLTSRGVDEVVVRKFKLGFCTEGKYAGRIIIPSFGLKGNVNFFEARTFVGDFYKFLKPEVPKGDIIFNELYVNFEEPVTLVEGVFDALKTRSFNTIPILGSTLDKRNYLFERLIRSRSSIYLALDLDATKKTERIASLLFSHGLSVKIIDTTPFKDVGEMSYEEFEARKARAREYGRLGSLAERIGRLV